MEPPPIFGLRRLATDPTISRLGVRAGIAGGIAMSAAMVPLLKRRTRDR